MLDGYRGVLAAFAAIAALLVATGAGAFYGSLYSPAKKQYATVSTDNGTSDTYQGVTESLPDIAFIPDPVERAIANPPPQSGQDHEKRDLAAQESMAVWAFYMALFAGMTALITGVGTYFIAAQVKLTREAVEDTSEATKAMNTANRIAMKANARATRRAVASAKETAAALEYAQRSAATAEDSLQEARQANINQLRPFLVITSVTVRDDLTEADAMFAQVNYENVGKSPALKASGENQFGFAPSIEALSTLPPVPEMPGGSKYTVATGKPHCFVTKCPGLNPRIYATVKAGGAILFARGWIRYADIFGTAYETEYLSVLTKDGMVSARGFQAAPFGNEIT